MLRDTVTHLNGTTENLNRSEKATCNRFHQKNSKNIFINYQVQLEVQ